jgi:hypothetical protein
MEQKKDESSSKTEIELAIEKAKWPSSERREQQARKTL